MNRSFCVFEQVIDAGIFRNNSTYAKKESLANYVSARLFLAEKEGFEPSMSYQPIHEFQSCAINRARRLLHI